MSVTDLTFDCRPENVGPGASDIAAQLNAGSRGQGCRDADIPPYTLSAATKANGTLAAIARAIMRRAIWGFVAKPTSSGTCAAVMRSGSSVHSFGR